MATQNGKQFHCDACGAMVVYAFSKAGNRYLAEVKIWQGDMGGMRSYLPSHNCRFEDQERWQKHQNNLLSIGAIIKGQHITVTAGRKVAKGTSGVIFWIDETALDYDNKPLQTQRLGFKDDAGNVFWTTRKNVMATSWLVKEA